jgi:RimJ/RimL family protein N-acetyltransferase
MTNVSRLLPAQGGSAANDFPPIDFPTRDGRHVTIRAIHLDDAAELQDAMGRLSREARYTRFMTPLKQLSPAMLERAVRPGHRERALVAVTGGVIVGGARYVKGSDEDTCEFAVTIADDWRGAGIASRMLRALIEDARSQGWEQMEGYVLASNSSMLRLARRLGFEAGPSEEGPSVKMVRLDLVEAACKV